MRPAASWQVTHERQEMLPRYRVVSVSTLKQQLDAKVGFNKILVCLHTGVCKQTLIRRGMHVGVSACGAPTQGLERSFFRCFARRRLAQQGCFSFSTDTGSHEASTAAIAVVAAAVSSERICNRWSIRMCGLLVFQFEGVSTNQGNFLNKQQQQLGQHSNGSQCDACFFCITVLY